MWLNVISKELDFHLYEPKIIFFVICKQETSYFVYLEFVNCDFDPSSKWLVFFTAYARAQCKLYLAQQFVVQYVNVGVLLLYTKFSMLRMEISSSI